MLLVGYDVPIVQVMYLDKGLREHTLALSMLIMCTLYKEYNQNATTIEDFLTNKCRIDLTDRDNYAICRDMYHNYVLHCKNSNKIPVSDNVFGSHLISKGIKKERRTVNSTREHCYVGVTISQ